MKIYRSFSSAETKLFGQVLAKKLLKREARNTKRKEALILALKGELGSGKTTFIQGFLTGLGVGKRSTSPTFIIFRRFTFHVSGFKSVYHVDAYRIKKPRELLKLGFSEILADSRNIVIIEWADKIAKILPRNILRLNFLHGAKEHERTIRFNREF